jgi:hypothetical protein
VKLLTLSDCHLRHKRHQVVRNAQRVFTDEPAFVRANRIEIAQNTNPPIIVGPRGCYSSSGRYDGMP